MNPAISWARGQLAVCALALPACAGTKEPELPLARPDEGPPESVYQRDRRTEIRIGMAAGDWDSLRHEGRSLADALQAVPTEYDYGEYTATVTARRWFGVSPRSIRQSGD